MQTHTYSIVINLVANMLLPYVIITTYLFYCGRSKLEKTIIVSEIVDTIRSLSPDGGFIKREKFLTTDEDIDGNTITYYQYYEVGDRK